MDVLVNIDVDDLDRAATFYSEALGFERGRRFGAALEMLGGSARIYLLARAPGSRAAASITQARDYRRHWTPVHMDFVVDDIHAATRRAVDAGAGQEGAIATHSWGDIAHLADPFGHGFCLIQFSGRGYDEIVTG